MNMHKPVYVCHALEQIKEISPLSKIEKSRCQSRSHPVAYFSQYQHTINMNSKLVTTLCTSGSTHPLDGPFFIQEYPRTPCNKSYAIFIVVKILLLLFIKTDFLIYSTKQWLAVHSRQRSRYSKSFHFLAVYWVYVYKGCGFRSNLSNMNLQKSASGVILWTPIAQLTWGNFWLESTILVKIDKHFDFDFIDSFCTLGQMLLS